MAGRLWLSRAAPIVAAGCVLLTACEDRKDGAAADGGMFDSGNTSDSATCPGTAWSGWLTDAPSASSLAYAPSFGGYLVLGSHAVGFQHAAVSLDGVSFRRLSGMPPGSGGLACSPFVCVIEGWQSYSGADWTPIVDPDDIGGTTQLRFWHAVWDGSQFIAFREDRVYTSSQFLIAFSRGQTMTATPVGGGSASAAVIGGARKWGETWVSARDNTVLFSSAPVPLNWQVVTLPTTLRIGSVAKSPDTWVAVAVDGSMGLPMSEVWTSPDGLAWTRSDIIVGVLSSVAWAGTDFVLVGPETVVVEGGRVSTVQGAAYRGKPGAWTRGGYSDDTSCFHLSGSQVVVANGRTFILGSSELFGVP